MSSLIGVAILCLDGRLSFSLFFLDGGFQQFILRFSPAEWLSGFGVYILSLNGRLKFSSPPLNGDFHISREHGPFTFM